MTRTSGRASVHPRGLAPLLLCLAALPPAVRAATLPVPLDVNGMAARGEAKITATAFDINDASKIFDDDRDSLARTASINPAFVQVVFQKPQTITGVRVRFTSERHDWTVRAGAAGPPDRTIARETFRGEDPQTVTFAQPVVARTFRLDVTRKEGDNYVHILDWELLRPGEVTGLTVTRDLAGAPKDADVTENTVLTFRAAAKTADGRTLDVTKDVAWSAPGASAWRGAKNRFLVTEPGEAQVTATLGDLSGSLTVPVKPYADRNNRFDLDAMYIERTPRIAYDANPKTGGWPEPGQRVGWVAHLYNWGSREVHDVAYTWVLDGEPVSRGVIHDWKPETETTVTYPWTWEKKRHTLTFLLDADSDFPEELSKANNQVTIATDALAVGYWVEDGLWRYMHAHQIELGDGMNSFEDWGQRQMRLWNQMFADAKYGSSPNGILDRVRLDLVVRVPNGALPLNGGIPTNNPDVTDKTVDLMWGMVSRDFDTFWAVKHGGPFDLEYGLIHELDHARYLIDSYGFDVHKDAVADLKLPDGAPLAGSTAMPFTGGVVRYDKYRGMMDSTHYFSEYEAYAWNRIAGQRARKGNQNGPDDIGVYLEQDLPKRNHVRFVDETGKPLAGATVEVHQARPMKDEWYGKLYLQKPDMTLTTDKDGWVTLPQDPFGDKIVHGYGYANSVLLFIVKRGDTWRTAFQEASDFNLQYWKGQKDDAYYQVAMNFAPNNTTLATTAGLPNR